MSLMKRLMDDFHTLAQLNNEDFEQSMFFEQFVSFANNCHQMDNQKIIAYMDNMVEIVSSQNPGKVSEVNEIKEVLNAYR